MPLTITNVAAGTNSIIVGGATSAAPAINTIICDSGFVSSGNTTPTTYLVSLISGQVGTFDQNASNILLNLGGTPSSNVISGGATYGPLLSLPLATSGGSPQRFRIVIPAPGLHVYVLVGNTAGGAGSIYVAEMTLTRIFDSYAAI